MFMDTPGLPWCHHGTKGRPISLLSSVLETNGLRFVFKVLICSCLFPQYKLPRDLFQTSSTMSLNEELGRDVHRGCELAPESDRTSPD